MFGGIGDIFKMGGMFGCILNPIGCVKDAIKRFLSKLLKPLKIIFIIIVLAIIGVIIMKLLFRNKGDAEIDYGDYYHNPYNDPYYRSVKYKQKLIKDLVAYS